jgi:hypothetical protein
MIFDLYQVLSLILEFTMLPFLHFLHLLYTLMLARSLRPDADDSLMHDKLTDG